MLSEAHDCPEAQCNLEIPWASSDCTAEEYTAVHFQKNVLKKKQNQIIFA